MERNDHEGNGARAPHESDGFAGRTDPHPAASHDGATPSAGMAAPGAQQQGIPPQGMSAPGGFGPQSHPAPGYGPGLGGGTGPGLGRGPVPGPGLGSGPGQQQHYADPTMTQQFGGPYQQFDGANPQQYGGPQQMAAQPVRRRGVPKALTAFGLVAAMLLSGGIGGVIGASVTDGRGTVVTGSPANPIPASKPTDGSVESVAENVVPSVVSITASGRSQGGEGSGIVLSADGMIMTNAHVATAGGNSSKLQVTFSDGSVSDANLVAADASSDIAVIKVDKAGLTPIAIGSAKGLKVGQDVVAIGSPLGLSGTVTTGIVSALDRPVMAGGEQSGQSTVLDAIQTDAAINPGNSGGALVDMGGNLVGMNSAIASLGQQGEAGSIGLGFAIPVDQAKRIADQLISQGFATRAVLGASVVSDPRVVGAQISGLESGGPAQKAGLPDKVTVTKLGDRVIDSGDELVAAVRSHAPGDQVTLTYRDAGGAEKTVEVTLGEAK